MAPKEKLETRVVVEVAVGDSFFYLFCILLIGKLAWLNVSYRTEEYIFGFAPPLLIK